MTEIDPEVAEMMEELRQLGATVETGPVATNDEVKRVEAKLGFALPDEMKEFFSTIGRIAITRGRTWFIYGLAEACAQTEVYRQAFDAGRKHTPFGYYPSRYLVLHDQGDYSNFASGTVYDADLDAFLVTDGERLVDREDAFQVGFWGYLLDVLSDILDEIREHGEEA